MLKIETSTRGTDFMPFLIFRRDHLRSTFAVYICGSGSFAVEFRDHLQSVVISGDVQFLFFFSWGRGGNS